MHCITRPIPLAGINARITACAGLLLFVLAMALPAFATPTGAGPDFYDEGDTLVEGTIPPMPANLPQQAYEHLSGKTSGPAAPTLRVVIPVMIRQVLSLSGHFRLIESTFLSIPIYQILRVLRR